MYGASAAEDSDVAGDAIKFDVLDATGPGLEARALSGLPVDPQKASAASEVGQPAPRMAVAAADRGRYNVTFRRKGKHIRNQQEKLMRARETQKRKEI